MNRKNARGLTLLELVVVLAILAVVTSMAVASLTAVEDQTRRDSSAELIDSIQRAVEGSNNYGSTVLKDFGYSFFTDVGRMPKRVGSQPDLYLRELWEKPSDVMAYAQVVPVPALAFPPTDIDDIRIGRGWRGPYLTLGVNKDTIRDGYGNPLALESVPTSHPTTLYHEWITKLQCLGSDGVTGPSTTPSTAAHDIPLSPLVFFDPDNPSRLFPDVSVTLTDEDGNPLTASANVHIIFPDPANVTTGCSVQSILLTPPATSHTFQKIPIGPRIIRVVQGTKKLTHRFLLQPGGPTANITLELK